MAKVTMPQLGESVAEGTIGKWLKQPGDHVAKYEPLLEVITDKVNAEVPSPFEGTLREILAEEGATVPNDAEIAIIDTADEARRRRHGRSSRRRPRPSSPPNGPAGSDERPVAEDRRRRPCASRRCRPRRPSPSPPARPRSPQPPAATGDADARMTPAVRRLLREHDLSPAQITGTGGGGRITREDVLAVVEADPDRRPGPGAPPPRARPASPSRSRSPRPPRPRPAPRSSSRTASTKSCCR